MRSLNRYDYRAIARNLAGDVAYQTRKLAAAPVPSLVPRRVDAWRRRFLPHWGACGALIILFFSLMWICAGLVALIEKIQGYPFEP